MQTKNPSAESDPTIPLVDSTLSRTGQNVPLEPLLRGGERLWASRFSPPRTLETYDATGGLPSILDPESRLTQTLRDGLLRVRTSIDGEGKTTAFGYDNMDNLTSVTDHDGGVTTYQYAPGREGRLLAKVIDARQNSLGTAAGTTFGYDPIGRLTSVTNAIGRIKTFGYDLKSNLKSVLDAEGNSITFGYDGLDRLITKHLPEGEVTYTYDIASRLTKVENYNGSIVELSYDELGRVTQTRQTIPGPPSITVTIDYAHDPNGNRTSMTTPWGSFSYTYDQLDRLTSITNPDLRTITFGYNALGQRTRMSYPNGTETTYAHDPAGQLTQILHRKTADNTALAWANYAYDPAGNRTSMTDYTGTHAYGYDDLHRLISASHPTGSAVPTKHEVFDYDRAGNRLFDANITAYQYDAANRLLENSSFTYAYDNNGNQTGKAGKQGQGTTTYAYNAENQLVQADMPDGTRQTNVYDGLGRRIEKSTGPIGNMVRYVYDNEDILAMLDGNNKLIALFTHGPGIDEPNIMKEPGGPEYFFHADALGSITALSDEAGEIVERIEYEAYGTPRFIDLRGGTPVTGDRSFTANPYASMGREWDQSIQFYFYRNRSQSPEIGRFIQMDPFGDSEGGAYVFVTNNPLSRTDAFGTADRKQEPNQPDPWCVFGTAIVLAQSCGVVVAPCLACRLLGPKAPPCIGVCTAILGAGCIASAIKGAEKMCTPKPPPPPEKPKEPNGPDSKACDAETVPLPGEK